MKNNSELKFCVVTENRDLWDPAERKFLRDCGVEELFIDVRFMYPDYSRERVTELRNLLENDGLYVRSSHSPFGSYNRYFSILRQSRSELQKELEWMKEFILRCGLLGIPAIPLHTSGAMLPASEEWEVEIAKAYVQELLPAAEEANVVIAIENTGHAAHGPFCPNSEEETELDMNRWSFDDAGKMLDFVHGFQSDYLKICHDVGHSHMNGRMQSDLDVFCDEIALFHLHDNDGVGSDSHMQPGYGNADWKTLFEKIKKYEKTPVLYVEAPPFHGDLSLMMQELNALANNKVIVKDGGFLKKDENTGRILILP